MRSQGQRRQSKQWDVRRRTFVVLRNHLVSSHRRLANRTGEGELLLIDGIQNSPPWPSRVSTFEAGGYSPSCEPFFEVAVDLAAFF
jgi:hypothetical protein